MRNRTTILTITAAALLTLGTTAGADERVTTTRTNTMVRSTTTDASYDAALLESERQQLAWEAHNAKGVDKAQLRSDEERVQDMIDGLQRGDRVDPAEVDRVLNRTN